MEKEKKYEGVYYGTDGIIDGACCISFRIGKDKIISFIHSFYEEDWNQKAGTFALEVKTVDSYFDEIGVARPNSTYLSNSYEEIDIPYGNYVVLSNVNNESDSFDFTGVLSGYQLKMTKSLTKNEASLLITK